MTSALVATALVLAGREERLTALVVIALFAGAVVLGLLRLMRQGNTLVAGRRLADDLARGRRVDVDAFAARLDPTERPRALAAAAAHLADLLRAEADDAEEEDDVEDEEPDEVEDDGEDEPLEVPLDGPLADQALGLVRRALEAAGDDHVTAQVDAARALVTLGRTAEARALVARLTARDGLGDDDVARLAPVALSLDQAALADDLYARALAARPDDLDLVCGRAEALLALDRAADAVPALEAAMKAVRRRMQSLDFAGVDLEPHWQRVTDLHDVAVRRSASAEKQIDAHVAVGALDVHAGVNYRLMGHSLLVESDRPARRRVVADQARLRADAEARLAADPADPAGLEDLGLWRLREGEAAEAEALFRRALERDPRAWPAFVGLGAALDARQRSLRRWLDDAVAPPAIPGLERLVDPWDALTDDERRLVALSLAPVAGAVPALVAAGGRLHVVSLEARCTDLPTFAEARGVLVEDERDRRTHDAIDGLTLGVVAAAKIDTFYATRDEGWTVAHELGHALHAVLSDDLAAEVERMFARSRRKEWLSTEYGQTNVYEFFATGYERFAARAAFPDGPRAEVDRADAALGVDAFFHDLAAALAEMPHPEG
ncbi:MAG: hypothetical protein M9894_17420 [Planctomycetes bacterium]|nr:hypothetical protein [Planctomycetota bacterium]